MKIVLVGNCCVGNSCLIGTYQNQEFPDYSAPTVLDVYKITRTIRNVSVDIELHDVAGDPHLGVNRQVSYNRASAFILCVSSNDRNSLESIDKWVAEINSVRPKAPIYFFLTKSDL